jgi:hypothetical protein
MTTMRPIRPIATVLLLASLAIAGCVRSQPNQSATPTGVPPAATPTTKAPVPDGDTTSREPVVLGDGRHPVIIKTVDADRRRITFDLIQLYFGEDAANQAAKDHKEFTNDIYSRNVNPRLRTLPVAADAPITVNVLAAQSTGSATKDVSVTLAKLASYFPNSGTPPFWITVEQGQVTTIAQQYLP